MKHRYPQEADASVLQMSHDKISVHELYGFMAQVLQ